ncbi:SusC/RagA family TonB-linked outer membrane protein [Sphingobacterium sp. HJSM2_6]|uniref:SusC/RagA family TonB-linked outer membrane protein n=1 Tax=Sphingobacterium sp. HJSM2_6 TaxID=3366264 RepID=UPI003BBC7BB1
MNNQLFPATWNILTLSRHIIDYMKLTILMFFISMFAVMANGLGQQISLNLKDASLKTAFLELTKQGGYTFVYDENDLQKTIPIHISVSNVEIEQVLDLLLKDQGLQYQLTKKTIIIQALVKNNLQAKKNEVKLQQITRGRIVNEKKEALVGVSIRKQGSKEGTITDKNGEFIFENLPENSTLVISYLGYTTQTISSKYNLGEIILISQAELIDAAVIRVNTGYQSLPKERMTGAFSYVSGEQLELKLATGIKNALEGQAAGIVIDKSGNIEIRGISTFNAEKTPLLVVDGYPISGNINDINPLNIASITILKDGVAASIYGSRAANGVIVVTTKNGLSGKPTIKYSSFFNVIARPQLEALNRASTSDYIDAQIDLYHLNPNSPSTISRVNMNRVTYLLMQVREGKITETEAMMEINDLRKIDGTQQIEKAFFRNEINQQHNLGISGGAKDYSYNLSINYQGTQKNMISNDNKRFIIDLKNEWKPFEFLTMGLAANVTLNKNESSRFDFETFTSYNSSSMLQPYTNLWNADGQELPIWGISQYKVNTYKNTPGMKNWDYFPLQELNNSRVTSTVFSSRINGFLRAKIFKGLSAEVGGNWERGNSLRSSLQLSDAYAVRIAYNDGTSKSNNANHYFPDGSVINENRNIQESWTLRSQINYNQDFQQEKHRIYALLGNEVRQLTYNQNQIGTRLGYNPTAGSFIPVNIKDYLAGIYSADMLFPSSFGGISDGQFAYGDNRFVSWYANGSYEYDNRFIISGSTRLDLTNFFGTDRKYRYKPMWSLGGTYKLSQENFWNGSVLNKLFIRASYGINGNISMNNGPHLILRVGTYNATTGGIQYNVASPPNNQLRWEKTKITNLGVDFGLFNNRIDGTLDYYIKNSGDLLASDAIDQTLGYSSLMKNVGKMSNHGIELSMNIIAVNTNKFNWMVSPNVTYNVNKVLFYNVKRPYTSSYLSGGGILAANYPSGAIFGYRFAGLNNKGETQIYNKNKETILVANATPDDLYYQGTFRPKWDLALTNRFKYQDLSLSFMFIAKLGHKYRKDGFSGSNIQNRFVGKRWRKPGDEAHTIYPVLMDWNMDMFDFPYIDKLVANASYAKLRDVTISYDLSRFTKSIHIANAQIYMQGRNLFRITDAGVDIDPETAEVNTSGGVGPDIELGFTSLPVPREFFLGLKVGF